jgi:micrococcal nuclease
MYTYKASVIAVTDGDTIVVDIDLGFGVWVHKQSIRMAKINAPELKGSTIEAAKKSKEFLKSLILNKWVTIRTEKDSKEKYGRWLATVLIEEDKNLIEINSKMVKEGHAKSYIA